MNRLPSANFVSALDAALERPLRLDDRWSLWRVYAVRGAGFPVTWLERFCNPDLSARRADVVATRHRCDEARTRLHACVRQRLACHGDEPGRPWHRALQAIQKRRPVVEVHATDAAARALATAYADAVEAAAAALETYRRAYATADAAWTEVARDIARDLDFRAAVAWQNETALAHLTRYFARAPAGQVDGEARQSRRLVARYLQRYCAKNEQIGFFGPCGWGLLDTRAALVAGATVASELRPYFEYWAVAALADRAAALDPDALAPRLSPDVRIDAQGLVLPDAVLPLDAAQRAFLAALDGRLSVAALIARDPSNAAAVRALIAQLAATGVIDWRLPIPVAPDASHMLDACLAALPGHRAFHARWRELDAARAALATLPRAELPSRIAAFNLRFAELAGTSSQRLGGAAYAGRTPLYVDAVRDLELSLPDAVFTALAPALLSLLDSAQWYAQQLVTQYLAYVTAVWRSLAAGDEVPLATLWRALQADTDTALAIGDDVVEQLQERWRALLDIDPAQRRQHFDADAIADRARDAFALTAPLWAGARFHAPDLLLAARDLSALERGEWLAVLGEIHPCTNLMMQTVTSKLSPVRDAMLRATARVQCEPELVPAIARDARGHRTAYSLDLAHDFTIEHGPNLAARPDGQVLRIADLVVRDSAAGPIVASLASGRHWPLVQFVGPQLRSIGISRFKPFATTSHLPRLTLGRLVIQRESWRVARETLEFIHARERATRWLGLRQWADDIGLPRHCFYRVPGELKPWYLDLESPVYCDLFADTVRSAAEGTVTLGEMLPAPDECWLRDGRDQRYTAELRMAAFTPPSTERA